MSVRQERWRIIEPPTYAVRLTIQAREALDRAWEDGDVGAPNDVDRPPSAPGIPLVTLRQPPRDGVVLVRIAAALGLPEEWGLRCLDEPSFPGELPHSVVSWHERGAWVPCPTCGLALVWYEAGYVPGYRICLRGHHARLADDGRSARAVRS